MGMLRGLRAYLEELYGVFPLEDMVYLEHLQSAEPWFCRRKI